MGDSFAQVSAKYAENAGEINMRGIDFSKKKKKNLEKSVTLEDDLSLGGWSHIYCF